MQSFDSCIISDKVVVKRIYFICSVSCVFFTENLQFNLPQMKLNELLTQSKIIAILMVFFVSVGFAQSYTINGNVNSSTLTCATFTGRTIVYIGDGVTDSKLIMNNNLNLTTCGLGAIQFIIRNKGILEFSTGNYNLNLPMGSSVVIESGGNIATIGSCSNSDLIQIGGNSVATCQGGGMPSFDEVVENGGINEAGILSGNQYICSVGGNTTFASSESGGTFTSGSTSVATVNATSGVITGVAVGQSVITYTKENKSTTRIVYVGSSFGGMVSGGTIHCSSTNSTVLTLSGYKGTINRWESSLNNFATPGTNIANTTSSYTVTNLANTTSYRAVINGTGCTANSTSGTIIVGTNFSASVSIAASPSGAICSGTSVTFTATPTNGGTTPSYQWKLNGVNVGTNITTYTNSALSNNDLVTCVMISNATCVIGSPATSNTITIVVNSANSWTGTTNSSWFTATNWSCGSVPTSLSDVFIPNVLNKPEIDDINMLALANTLTVSSGSSLTVNSGNTLKVTNAVTNNGGTITFEDSASLVQINNVTNSGNITYKRQAGVRNTDYTYWSSPVSPLKLAGVGGISYSPPSLAGSIFYSYLVTTSSENWKSETAATSMIPGLGYSIRASGAISTNPPSLLEASFTGVSNNGPYSVEISKSGASYLLGNPYPSAIDGDKFLQANENKLGGTLYFWTHNTVIQNRNLISSTAGSGAYAYTSDDYAIYNGTGGVGAIDPGTVTGSAPSDPNHSVLVGGIYVNNGIKPTGKIAAGQGFFATGIATGTVNFTNAMRLAGTTNFEGTGTNQQFFKTKNPNTKIAKGIEKNRVWLNLSNIQGAFKQTLIGYVTDATNEYDSRFDGESFDGNEYVDFYSVNQDKSLTIQGRALPFDENDEVPLGYRTTINGEFTINIDQVDGSLTNQAVYIEDKLTNTVFDLKRGNYTFTTFVGTFNDRFVLRYTNKTLGKEEVELNDGILALYSNNYKTLIIQNNVKDATVNAVELFNLLGQNIANWMVNDKDQNHIQIPVKNVQSDIYIVKIKTTKGEFSKKIIIKD